MKFLLDFFVIKKMKKTVWIFSLMVMLLTQVFSPFAYATSGDMAEIEETPVVVQTEDETVATETKAPEVVNEPGEIENSLADNDTLNWNNNEPQAETWGIQTQIQQESQTWAIIGDNITSWDVKVLSWGQENLKEENEVLSWSKEWSWFIETIKNLFWIWDNEEKNEVEEFESKEIYWTGEYEWVKVEVYAATWLFASWTILTIKPIIEENLEQVKEVLSWEVELIEEENKETVVAFDITFRDSITKEELQPRNWSVQVTFNYNENEKLKQAEYNEEQEVKVYHLNDIDEKWNKIEGINWIKVEEVFVNDEESNKNKIVVDVRKFSPYVILLQWVEDEYTISFETNGWTLKNPVVVPRGSKLQTTIRKYSHTDNISDDWVQQGQYGKWLRLKRSVTIEWASQISVSLRYETEHRDDTFYVFQWIYNWSVSSSIQNWRVLKYWPNKEWSTQLNINGNTVTFVFYSDNYYNGYWYYAIIEWVVDSDYIAWRPVNPWKIFDWWYKDEELTQKLTDSDIVNSNMKLYAKRKSPVVTLLPWSEFNKKIKSIAKWSTVTDVNTDDNLIINIVWTWENSNYSSDSNKLLSLSTSEAKMYARFDETEWILYYHSEGDEIFLNEDSEYMFNDLKKLEIVDLSDINASKVTNMNDMFYGDEKLKTIYQPIWLDLWKISSSYVFNQVDNLVWWNWTKYSSNLPNYQNKKYATWDTENQIWYFTDPDRITVKFIVLDDEYWKQVVKRWESFLQPESPIIEWYQFDGRYIDTNQWMKEFDFTQWVQKYTELHAKMRWNETKFISWKDFNQLIKTISTWLVNRKSDYNDKNIEIRKIERMNTLNDEKYLVSTMDSKDDIFLWYDNWIINYYSEAETLYLNSDSSYMFYNLGNLEELNISEFKYEHLLKIDNMFSSCENLKTIYAVTGFNTENIEPTNVFYNEKLVWWNGTKFVWTTVGKDYARIDKENEPWFFTDKNWISVKFYLANDIYTWQFIKKWWLASQPDLPIISWFTFQWWYKDEALTTPFDFSQKIDAYTEVFWKMPWIEAMFLTWKNFNLAIKQLANPNVLTYEIVEDNIKQIKKSSNMPIWKQTKVVSDPNSQSEILARFDDWVIYYYSNAYKIFMNPDSSYMFYWLEGLENINITEFDSNKVTKMDSLFEWISSITGINLNNFVTTKVSTMKNMLSWCTSLVNINMDNWDFTLNWTSIWEWMFTNTPSLKKMSAKNWVLPTYFQSLFTRWWCYTLEEIDVSYWNLRNAKYLENLFKDASSLKRIIWLNTRKTNTIERMSNMFENCSSLTSLDINNRDVHNIEYINYAFKWCSGLESLDLSKWRFSRVGYMNDMFNWCTNLRTLNLEWWNLSSLYGMYYANGMFTNTPNLNNLIMSWWKVWSWSWGGWLNTLWLNNIEEINVSNRDISELSSLENMFQNYSNLKRIYWLETWNVENIIDMDDMFQNCISLEYINLGNWNTSNLKYMNSMFNNCKNLKSIDLSSWNVKNVWDMNSLFSNCESLETINLEWWNMKNVTSFSSFFQNNYSLKDLNLSWLKLPNYYFYWFCRSRSMCTSPLTEINTTNRDFSWANNIWSLFADLNNIETISWMNTWKNTEWLTSMNSWFYNCKNLKNIDLSNIKTDNVSDMGLLFYWCENLSEIDVSTWNTSKVTNMWNMFYNTTNLKTIYVWSGFKTNSVISSGLMFQWATSLIWWNWTIYSWNHTDWEYAVIDDEYYSWYFTNILDKPYTITYDLDWWTMSWEKATYTQRDSFIIPIPIKQRHIFKWWAWSNWNIPEMVVKINTWTKWNLNYKAWWEYISSWQWRQIKLQNIEDQEHNVADEKEEIEKKEDKQETKEDIETKTPETIKWTTNSSSVDSEVQSAYQWAYKHDVTTMPTLEDAMPDWVVKRWHLAKMVVNYAVNVLWYTLPEKIPVECSWNDWKTDWESDEIKDYAKKACALWLMWIDMPKFIPNMEVTRAQFGTIMSRLLWWKEYAWWTPYYRKHLNALKENNIMTQIENPEKRTELRQWVWLMLMRSAENK